MTASRTPCTPPYDMAAVLAGMRALDRELPARDGVAAFNRVYLTVTQEIAGRLAAGGFADPRIAGDLAGRFAARYLTAVTPSGRAPYGTRRGRRRLAPARRPPACWRPLLRMRADCRVRPVQFAVAGINAHVGHDLALAVVDTCRAASCPPARLREDFDRVGAVLAAMETRVREQVMPGPDLLEAADPLTHLVGAWSLSRARDAAWAAARLLWALRDDGDAFAACARHLDGWVAGIGRLLLTPLGPGRPRTEPDASGRARTREPARLPAARARSGAGPDAPAMPATAAGGPRTTPGPATAAPGRPRTTPDASDAPAARQSSGSRTGARSS